MDTSSTLLAAKTQGGAQCGCERARIPDTGAERCERHRAPGKGAVRRERHPIPGKGAVRRKRHRIPGKGASGATEQTLQA
ncbi:hypothetical protein BD626DRAFT_516378 [Schizophyllum amplum]|uniref:Uncharacterized protein n=1 Tax=Schizophyllum amplum TaxID=97359 RepID=A0A550BX22_9AGAR|nr:hypothetical protein BD626DRAFT_516378 [Auriculariopsis ampla]